MTVNIVVAIAIVIMLVLVCVCVCTCQEFNDDILCHNIELLHDSMVH